jgi:hypothetical protein
LPELLPATPSGGVPTPMRRRHRSAHVTRLVPLAIASLLIGCVGIEARVSFAADGSGQLVLTYRVSRLASELRIDDSSALPLPVAEEDFRLAVAAVDGLTLQRYARSENSDDFLITATIAFDRVETLAQLSGFADMEASLESAGEAAQYRQVAARARPADQVLTEQAEQMLVSLFGAYEVVFVLETPRPITASTGGILSDDRRELVFSMSLPEWVTSAEDRALTATW